MGKYSDFNIYTALEYLKDSYIIVSFENHITTYFYKKNDNIVVTSANLKINISEKDFLKTYKDSKFSLIENDDSYIDLKKDEEYYSWKNK